MSFGDPAWQPWVIDEEKALPLLKAAYDRGLNTWDTANVYSNGVSEEIIGKAIRKYEIPRNKIVVLSKCYGYVGEEPGVRGILYGQDIAKSKDYVNRGGEFFFPLGFSFRVVSRSLQSVRGFRDRGPELDTYSSQYQASPAPPSSKQSTPPSPASNSSTSTYCKSTASTPTRRSKRQCWHSTTSCEPAKCTTSAPAACGHGSSRSSNTPPKKTAGRSSSACRTTTTCSTARKSAR